MIDLSGGEVSEVAFAAFYADCEHAVRPVTAGHRVCLIFNLGQTSAKKGHKAALTAPDYEPQIAQAAALLGDILGRSSGAAKVAWLLEHQYRPAGLAFSALKAADAAKARVLVEAAARADCAVHLGIVHIEESGPAEPLYSDYEPRRRGRYYDDDFEEDVGSADAGDDEFEVVEVSDSWRYVDQWIDPQDRAVPFGKIPLGEGELLPQGALDDEKADEQRLTEATGNEGASFERSYHRAAVVIWHRTRYADVLLDAGVGAALPWLKARVAAGAGEPARSPARREAAKLARRMIQVWKGPTKYIDYRATGRTADRAEMIGLLAQLGDTALLEEFVAVIVTPGYDGSENAALVAHLPLLPTAKLGELAAALVRLKMRSCPGRCVELLLGLIAERSKVARAATTDSLRPVADAIVAGLDDIEAPPPTPRSGRWQSKYLAAILEQEFPDDETGDELAPGKPGRQVDAALVANVLTALGGLNGPEAEALREIAARKIAARPIVFDPVTVVTPALGTLHQRRPRRDRARPDGAEVHLWVGSAEFLLHRSEFPPTAPSDWRQEAVLSCRCEDCRELQAFVQDPGERVHRFRVRKDRRQHLHQSIDAHDLAMTHVTERSGSPQTLVGTKDRRHYQRCCEQYRQDVAALAKLGGMADAGGTKSPALTQRIEAARARLADWSPD